MTEEIQTTEYSSEPAEYVDYTEILENIRTYTEIIEEVRQEEVKQTELLQSWLPEIRGVGVLLLGSFIVLTVFRLLTSFLGRVFNDTTKF